MLQLLFSCQSLKRGWENLTKYKNEKCSTFRAGVTYPGQQCPSLWQLCVANMVAVRWRLVSLKNKLQPQNLTQNYSKVLNYFCRRLADGKHVFLKSIFGLWLFTRGCPQPECLYFNIRLYWSTCPSCFSCFSKKTKKKLRKKLDFSPSMMQNKRRSQPFIIAFKGVRT